MVHITGDSVAATTASSSAAPRAAPVGASRAAVRTPAPSVPRPPPRSRRRPVVIGAGVALLALGALTSAWLVSAAGDTVPVVAVAADVQRGAVLDRTDLRVVEVRPDPVLAIVAEARLEEVVGSTAATGLLAGSLLTPASTTDQLLPAEGTSVVGVALGAGQLPAEPLVPGDRVRIVDTPPAQADPPAVDPDTIGAQVVSVAGPDDVGLTTVDVLVPAGDAAGLAARVATGRVALVLDSREG